MCEPKSSAKRNYTRTLERHLLFHFYASKLPSVYTYSPNLVFRSMKHLRQSANDISSHIYLKVTWTRVCVNKINEQEERL